MSIATKSKKSTKFKKLNLTKFKKSDLIKSKISNFVKANFLETYFHIFKIKKTFTYL